MSDQLEFACVSCGHAEPTRDCGCRDCGCGDLPHIRRTPHYRWPESWPGKVEIFFEQGNVELENSHDGSILFVRVGRDSMCLTLGESIRFYHELGKAVDEQVDLTAKYDLEG